MALPLTSGAVIIIIIIKRMLLKRRRVRKLQEHCTQSTLRNKTGAAQFSAVKQREDVVSASA